MKKNLVIYFLSCVCMHASAQTLSLRAVLDSIQKNNPLLLSYANRINADSAMIPAASAWMPPTAGIEFDKNPYSFNNFYNGVVRISIMQNFPNRKVIDATSAYYGSFSSIDLNEYCYQRNKLFSQAKETYFNIYITQKNISILNQNIATLESMIDLAEKQMATGKGDLSSIYLLQAKKEEAQAKLIHEQNMILADMANIDYLMNADVRKTFSIDTNNVVRDYRNLLFEPEKDSLETRRSDIMQMNSIIYSMKLKQNMTALSSRPIFGLKVEHFAIMGMPDMFSVMGTMTINIAPWSARKYKSQVRSMGFQILDMQQQKQNMVNMTFSMIQMLTIEMNSEYREVDTYSNKVIPAYQKSLDANLLAYGQNSTSMTMVLMSYDDLQMAQMEYLKHLGTLLNVQASYEREMQIQ
ncbi:MAG: TolC family protein [Bacteroidetes bacterium]|nr:TolC family protein [Bacteroidota bacterium]